jgi:hypothetical protein
LEASRLEASGGGGGTLLALEISEKKRLRGAGFQQMVIDIELGFV